MWTWGSKLGPGVSVCVSELVLFEMSHGRVWDHLYQCQLHPLDVWSQRQHRRVSAKNFPNPVHSVLFNGERSVNMNYCIFDTVGRGEVATYANLSSSRRKFIHSGGLSMGRRYGRNARGV